VSISLTAPSWQAGAPAIVGGAAWRTAGALVRSGSDLIAEVVRYVGQGKFTVLPGAWCADAVSFWLRAAGPRAIGEPHGRFGASLRTACRRPAAGRSGRDAHAARRRRHVGVAEAVDADGAVTIVSGNWSHRVARSIIARGSVTAFIAVR
jgi:hypothetical protein